MFYKEKKLSRKNFILAFLFFHFFSLIGIGFFYNSLAIASGKGNSNPHKKTIKLIPSDDYNGFSEQKNLNQDSLPENRKRKNNKEDQLESKQNNDCESLNNPILCKKKKYAYYSSFWQKKLNQNDPSSIDKNNPNNLSLEQVIERVIIIGVFKNSSSTDASSSNSFSLENSADIFQSYQDQLAGSSREEMSLVPPFRNSSNTFDALHDANKQIVNQNSGSSLNTNPDEDRYAQKKLEQELRDQMMIEELLNIDLPSNSFSLPGGGHTYESCRSLQMKQTSFIQSKVTKEELINKILQDLLNEGPSNNSFASSNLGGISQFYQSEQQTSALERSITKEQLLNEALLSLSSSRQSSHELSHIDELETVASANQERSLEAPSLKRLRTSDGSYDPSNTMASQAGFSYRKKHSQNQKSRLDKTRIEEVSSNAPHRKTIKLIPSDDYNGFSEQKNLNQDSLPENRKRKNNKEDQLESKQNNDCESLNNPILCKKKKYAYYSSFWQKKLNQNDPSSIDKNNPNNLSLEQVIERVIIIGVFKNSSSTDASSSNSFSLENSADIFQSYQDQLAGSSREEMSLVPPFRNSSNTFDALHDANKQIVNQNSGSSLNTNPDEDRYAQKKLEQELRDQMMIEELLNIDLPSNSFSLPGGGHTYESCRSLQMKQTSFIQSKVTKEELINKILQDLLNEGPSNNSFASSNLGGISQFYQSEQQTSALERSITKEQLLNEALLSLSSSRQSSHELSHIDELETVASANQERSLEAPSLKRLRTSDGSYDPSNTMASQAGFSYRKKHSQNQKSRLDKTRIEEVSSNAFSLENLTSSLLSISDMKTERIERPALESEHTSARYKPFKEKKKGRKNSRKTLREEYTRRYCMENFQNANLSEIFEKEQNIDCFEAIGAEGFFAISNAYQGRDNSNRFQDEDSSVPLSVEEEAAQLSFCGLTDNGVNQANYNEVINSSDSELDIDSIPSGCSCCDSSSSCSSDSHLKELKVQQYKLFNYRLKGLEKKYNFQPKNNRRKSKYAEFSSQESFFNVFGEVSDKALSKDFFFHAGFNSGFRVSDGLGISGLFLTERLISQDFKTKDQLFDDSFFFHNRAELSYRRDNSFSWVEPFLSISKTWGLNISIEKVDLGLRARLFNDGYLFSGTIDANLGGRSLVFEAGRFTLSEIYASLDCDLSPFSHVSLNFESGSQESSAGVDIRVSF